MLHIDPETEPARAQLAHHSHLARAKWVAHTGYNHLLRGDIPEPQLVDTTLPATGERPSTTANDLCAVSHMRTNSGVLVFQD